MYTRALEIATYVGLDWIMWRLQAALEYRDYSLVYQSPGGSFVELRTRQLPWLPEPMTRVVCSATSAESDVKCFA